MRSVLNPQFRRSSEQADAFGGDNDSDYRRHEYRTPDVDATNLYLTAAPKRFDANGDHVTIHSIDGPGAIQIRFSENGAWIDVEQGTIITRVFDRIYMRDVNLLTGKMSPYTRVTFYTSFGPLYLKIARTTALKAGFTSRQFTLPASQWKQLDLLIANADDFDGYYLDGPMLIQVPSSSPSSVALAYRYTDYPYVGGDPANFFVIDPGNWVSIDYSGRISSAKAIASTYTGSTRMGIAVAPVTNASTALIQVICNRRSLLTDTDWAEINAVNALGMQ